MKAAWYEKQGTARDVLIVWEMDDPKPRTGEARIRLAFSGVNPGDVKKREDAFGVGMRYPRVIPHSDGSGTIDAVGEGISPEWIGRRVWCHGAQSYRPFGTAAEYTVVAFKLVVPLPRCSARARGMSRHSRYHRSSCCSRRRFGQGANHPRARWSGRGRRLCRSTAPDGIDYVVEIVFGANIKTDTEVLAQAVPSPHTPLIHRCRRFPSGSLCL